MVTQNQQLQFTVSVVTCRTWKTGLQDRRRGGSGREWEGGEGERGRGREEGREKERKREREEEKLTHPLPVVNSVPELHYREEERQRVKGGHGSHLGREVRQSREDEVQPVSPAVQPRAVRHLC